MKYLLAIPLFYIFAKIANYKLNIKIRELEKTNLSLQTGSDLEIKRLKNEIDLLTGSIDLMKRKYEV